MRGGIAMHFTNLFSEEGWGVRIGGGGVIIIIIILFWVVFCSRVPKHCLISLPLLLILGVELAVWSAVRLHDSARF